MELILYHYVHCPYCIRVRMAFGLLGLNYTSKVLPYNDEKTPIQLCQKKMLPIAKIDGTYMNESLDIINKVDTSNQFNITSVIKSPDFKELDELINKLAENVHNLAMPYWIYTAEFDEQSRIYFQKKKELKRGPFKDLVQNRVIFEKQLIKDLKLLEDKLVPYYLNSNISIFDILISAHLWGLYIVPEFQFSTRLNDYLQSVKKQCNFNYHQDFWS